MSKPRQPASARPIVRKTLLPAPNPLASPNEKPDLFQIGTIALSLLALIVAIWAANETRQTRLDTRRIQLRGEALAFLQETRAVVNTFNCYALVKGTDLKGKDEFMHFLAEEERLIRDGLSNIVEFSIDGLSTYEKSINSVRGRVQNTFNEQLVLIRNSWDKELRDKADSVCKI
jgi:hypothetical protein